MERAPRDDPPTEGGTVEDQLLAHVKGLERNYYEWRVVHLHLSQLKPCHRRHYQLRVAVSEFDSLLRQFRSELFQLSNGDIVYLWHDGAAADVDPVVIRLRYLFSDDPLASDAAVDIEGEADLAPVAEVGAAEPLRFCTWFDMEREYSSFVLHVEDLLEAIARGDGVDRSPARQPLDPAQLSRIEDKLQTMDLSGLIRRQSICAMLPQGAPKPLFAELFIAVRELSNILVPGTDLAGDTWLFQRLAESLDRRLLASLAKHEPGAPQDAISINLRLATLLSPEFLEFDHEYRRPSSSPVIIELQLIDIFAELGAYLFIREFVRERGYLICIDGLHYLHLPLIDRKRLGADLVKVIWTPDLLDGVSHDHQNQLKAAIKRAGIDRVILCRCDSVDAVRWGQSMGIRLFQGHYIDSRLRAARPRAVAAAREAMRGGA